MRVDFFLALNLRHLVEMSGYVQMYYLAYDKAKGILQNNYRVLEKTVEELLEFEILTGKVKNSTQ